MCGIAGFTRFNHSNGDETTLIEMGNSIRHRGPDFQGTYLDEHVGLCHQRLSIIDLSAQGNQPMTSNNERYTIVFNGEIYNFQKLKVEAQQKGYHFKSSTDTEVILAFYEYEGAECVKKFIGMFAIAIWDREKKELFLARDRLGKKPLYYFNDGSDVIFASEIKALLKTDRLSKKIRLDGLYDFFTYQYLPDPKSIFQDIHKLKPGYWIKVSQSGVQQQQYWDLSWNQVSEKSEQELSSDLIELLKTCTKDRMVSDVPLGAFLSGGIDSSAVVALMANQADEPVTTCSIGFDSKKFDEVEYAEMVAEQYSTSHHELTVKENIVEHIETISHFFDEPFADPSLVPTYFVSKLARQKVTVAIAGDGGDENFAGYEKYVLDKIENQFRSHIPNLIRTSLLKPLGSFLSKGNHRLLQKGSTLLNTLGQTPSYGFFLTNAFCNDQLWNRLANDRLKQELDGYHPASVSEYYYHKADTDDHLSKVLYTDIKTFLAGDILTKVDRMSMANSLEVRAPLLDHRVVEFAASIPSQLKLKGKEKKYLLKQSASSILPDTILYRKKMGFSVPLAEWFRGEIKNYADSMIFRKESGIEHFFNMRELRNIWNEHQSGVRDYSSILWSFLMFEIWWKKYIDANGTI